MAGFRNRKLWVYAYLPAPTVTAITVANTFYPITWPFLNNPIEGFSVVGNSIVYSWPTKQFEIDWHATGSCDWPSAVVHVWVAINWETLTVNSPSAMATLMKTAWEVYAFSWTNVQIVMNWQTILLECTSDWAWDNITMEHFTTTIREFFND